MQFSLKYLWSFVRASPLSPQVKIFLKQDYPISLKYEMGSHGKYSLGEAIFLMAPKLEDEPLFPQDQQPQQPTAESRPEPAPAPRTKALEAAAIKSPSPSDQGSESPRHGIGAWHEDDPGDEEMQAMEWE